MSKEEVGKLENYIFAMKAIAERAGDEYADSIAAVAQVALNFIGEHCPEANA
jgi:hypothetical protein